MYKKGISRFKKEAKKIKSGIFYKSDLLKSFDRFSCLLLSISFVFELLIRHHISKELFTQIFRNNINEI